jgi:threonylcarbamoyladenosine tRNA methylthiotransferase MtaB
MASLAAAGGLSHALIVNTCAVTAEAESQARQAIRRAAREAPGRPIIVTGCAATLAPASWAALPGVTRVLGNPEKLQPQSWGAPETPTPPAATRTRARAFLEVQQGCDHHCTFCVIRLARGPSRTWALDDVLGATRQAVARGQQEVILTGVDLASWQDGAAGLAALVRACLGVPGLARLRLSSLDPAAVGADMLALWRDEPRLAPFLHLSAQHGDGLILSGTQLVGMSRGTCEEFELPLLAGRSVMVTHVPMLPMDSMIRREEFLDMLRVVCAFRALILGFGKQVHTHQRERKAICADQQ